MKSVRTAKTLYIVYSVLLGISGLLMIIFPESSLHFCCYVLGAVFLFAGLSKSISYFAEDMYSMAFQFDLALGIFMCICGLAMLLHPDFMLTLFAFITGAFVLIDGGFKLQTAMDAMRFGLKHWKLMAAGAVLCAAAGLLLMLMFTKISNAVVILTGAALLLDCLQNLFVALYTVKIREKTNPSGKY